MGHQPPIIGCGETATLSRIGIAKSGSGLTWDVLYARIKGPPTDLSMISATECRERAAECRQMADREHTSRIQSILIDMARTWDRLALEAENGAPRVTPKQVLRPSLRAVGETT
jgi:hypothetical protein